MEKKKATAPAEQSPVVIENARMTHMTRGDVEYPAATFTGDKPAKGSVVTLKMDNGSRYSGIVHDATEADGKVFIEFSAALKPA